MIDVEALDWAKQDGLLPAIVQDREGLVRMLGYMNREALQATLESGLVTFFSRSRNRLWVKGETSGNRLRVLDVAADCDGDALLVRAAPEGPTCHTGSRSCFGDAAPFFPNGLEAILAERAKSDPTDSYTARLWHAGTKRMAQKVGEEGVEVALAASHGDAEELVSEAADLVFHLTVLLQASDLGWAEVAAELERRHRERAPTASS